MRTFSILLLLLLGLWMEVAAQSPESLQKILERGHARQWLICGPFEPDVEGGLAAALGERLPLLGGTDYLTPLGGVRRARPSHGLEVRNPDGTASVWQLLQLNEGVADLAPYLADRDEAVAFVAFYAIADRGRTVLMEVESTLGARVIHNGFLVKDIRGGPIEDLGVSWQVLRMRTGVNLVLIELPGMRLEALGSAAGFDSGNLRGVLKRTRPMLPAKSGFEVAVRLHPAQEAGGVYVIPRLEPTGAFTGSVDNPRKEVMLRVFNPDIRPSEQITATVTRAGGGRPLRRSVPGISPGKIGRFVFEIPFGNTPIGQREGMQVAVVHGSKSIQFRTELSAEPPPSAGRVQYVERPRGLDMKSYLRAYRANALLVGSVEEYGFHLGAAYQWRAAWHRFPDARAGMLTAILKGRSAADAGYANPDARLVSGDTLVRNLQLGRLMSEAYLQDWSPVYYLWNQPALAFRFPDILDAAGGIGIVENLPYAERAPLGALLGPGAARIPYRHKNGAVVPESKEELRSLARLHRSELERAGFLADVLVGEYTGLPRPFWANTGVGLRRSVPSVAAAGGGGRSFFEALNVDLNEGVRLGAASALPLNSWKPGELVSQPAIKQAHARTEEALRQAETLATLAGFAGASFPDSALDAAWRELLWASDAERLGFSKNFETYASTLGAYRRSAAYSRRAFRESVAALLRGVDTYTDAPTRAEGVSALVVFNTASVTRSDLVELNLALDQFPGLTLLDTEGTPVPFVAEEIQVRNGRIARARFSFVARDVPGFGYTTYYLIPAGRPEVWSEEPGARIENDLYVLEADSARGGAITEFRSHESDTAFAEGLSNDLVAFPENRAQTENGRELWVAGAPLRLSAGGVTVRRFTGPGAQRLEITAPFLGGESTRRVTLYDGLDYAVCDLTLRDVKPNGHLVGLRFAAGGGLGEAVIGDIFGARTGRVSLPSASLRTRGNAHMGSALEPFLGFFGLLPGGAIRAEGKAGYPFRPVRIVLGDPAYEVAAEELIQSFAARGTPAAVADSGPEDRGAYTDSSAFENPYDAAQQGEFLWVLLGEEAEKESAPRSAILELLEPPADRRTPPAPVAGGLEFRAQPDSVVRGPRLRVPGHDVKTIEEHLRLIKNDLASRGAILVPKSNFNGAEPLPQAGLAVLHRGAGLVLLDPHAATWFLFHDSPIDGASEVDWPESIGFYTTRYGLYPVAGDWRASSLVQRGEGFRRPLQSGMTNLHLGDLPGRHSFLEIRGGRMVATGLRPSRMRTATLKQAETHPRDGVVFSLAEVSGRHTRATIQFAGTAFDAGTLNAAGNVIGSASSSRGLFEIDLPPGGFALAGFRPSLLGAPVLATASDTVARPEWARPWENGRGVLPEGNVPVSVSFHPPAEDSPSSITLEIVNNRTDSAASGVVRIEAGGTWAVGVNEVPYTLEASGYVQTQLLLLRGGENDLGYILASVEAGGVDYVDVWPRAAGYDATAERRGDEIQFTIVNRSSSPLIGTVELVTASDYWPELAAVSGVSVEPMDYRLRIAPYESKRVLFRLSDASANPPLAGKMGFNGEVRYLPVSRTR